jgi:hypothetical protein
LLSLRFRSVELKLSSIYKLVGSFFNRHAVTPHLATLVAGNSKF